MGDQPEERLTNPNECYALVWLNRRKVSSPYVRMNHGNTHYSNKRLLFFHVSARRDLSFLQDEACRLDRGQQYRSLLRLPSWPLRATGPAH